MQAAEFREIRLPQKAQEHTKNERRVCLRVSLCFSWRSFLRHPEDARAHTESSRKKEVRAKDLSVHRRTDCRRAKKMKHSDAEETELLMESDSVVPVVSVPLCLKRPRNNLEAPKDPSPILCSSVVVTSSRPCELTTERRSIQ